MNKYLIDVIETLKQSIIVQANSIEEAIMKVEDAISQDKIILTADDYDYREINPSTYWENGLIPDNEDVSEFEELEDESSYNYFELQYFNGRKNVGFMYIKTHLEFSGDEDKFLKELVENGEIEAKMVFWIMNVCPITEKAYFTNARN